MNSSNEEYAPRGPGNTLKKENPRKLSQQIIINSISRIGEMDQEMGLGLLLDSLEKWKPCHKHEKHSLTKHAHA